MCGIIGYVGQKNAVNIILDGLKSLEYRGYDSAGLAYRTCNRIEIVKSVGKLKRLENKIKKNTNSNIGIGHTRWATNGKIIEKNSHPHKVGKFTIVHNGAIENYDNLKLLLKGYKFKSDTDSEIIAALLDKLYSEKNDVLKVIKEAENLLIGSYALGILCDDDPNTLYGVKKDSPLIIGISDTGNFITSDVPGILKYTNKYIPLNDFEIVQINDSVSIYNNALKKINKNTLTFEGNLQQAEKDGYDHFMLKEIHQEPDVIKDTIHPFLKDGIISLMEQLPSLDKYDNITIIGCGSAYNAGLIGKYLIEKYADVKTDVYIASEFHYQKCLIDKKSLVIFISQSGETADTLACLRKVKQMEIDSLSIVNSVASSLARESDKTIYIKAGPEVSVATTKAYNANLSILSLIALNLGIVKNKISEKKANEIINSFENISSYLESMMNINYRDFARTIYKKNYAFYIGKGMDYYLSQEGALKLREISYIAAEAYPAGELKHGTISLIEKGTIVIAIATDKSLLPKILTNIEELKSRGASVILITNLEVNDINNKIQMPYVNDFINPLITTIALQLISYETAKLKGCDIDTPKNLVKSVTFY